MELLFNVQTRSAFCWEESVLKIRAVGIRKSYLILVLSLHRKNSISNADDMQLILWNNRPHAGAVKIQKPRGTRLRNSSGALPRLASPPFPSVRSPPCVARLHATVRKDHMTSVTSRATVHNAAFSACQIPAFIRIKYQ
jgi:hypothetical protein